jgi:HlyD family secretion protein
MLKYIVIIFAVAAVVVAGVMIDGQSRKVAERPSTPISGPVQIFAPGRVEGATDEIQLRTQLHGRITQLAVEEGQLIRKGDLLLQLDDDQYRHEAAMETAVKRQAEAELLKLINGARVEERKEAEALYQAQVAELERAQLTWDRIRQLRAERAITQQDADNQRTTVAALEAKVEAAKARLQLLEAEAREDEVEMARAKIAAADAKLKLAEVHLARTQLRAPTDGQILRLNVRPNELTGPDSRDPAVVFADTSRYRVRAYVEELDAPRVKVGMAAVVTADGLPDQAFGGRVVQISPLMGKKQLFTSDPAEHYDVKTREVLVALDEASGLVVGLRVDVTIDPTSLQETPDTAGVSKAETPGRSAWQARQLPAKR